MRRRLVPWVLLAIPLAACGERNHEAPAPPPIAASQRPAEPTPQPTPQTTTPQTERAAVDERVLNDAPALPVKPVATPPAPPTSDPNVPPPMPLPDPNAPQEAQPVDPLKAMEDSVARGEDYQRRLTRLSASLETARTVVAVRERDLLAFKNPFLPRPQLSAEEALAIQGMSGADRVKWAEGRLVEAKAAMEKAEKDYDDAKANRPLN